MVAAPSTRASPLRSNPGSVDGPAVRLARSQEATKVAVVTPSKNGAAESAARPLSVATAAPAAQGAAPASGSGSATTAAADGDRIAHTFEQPAFAQQREPARDSEERELHSASDAAARRRRPRTRTRRAAKSNGQSSSASTSTPPGSDEVVVQGDGRRTEPAGSHARTGWCWPSCSSGVLLMLVVSGVTSGQLGEAANAPGSKPGADEVPSQVRGGGPIVDPSTPQAGLRVPDRHVVLTFDDGPTEWTAKILDVLAAPRGQGHLLRPRCSGRRPTRTWYAECTTEGHEVGVHTFTHVNLANVPPWRLRLELDQTQLAIAAATGSTTDLLRAAVLLQGGCDDARRTGRRSSSAGNYRAVFTDLDTEGLGEARGRQDPRRRACPRDDEGAVVMLHDGGGERSQTVTALGQPDRGPPAARLHLRHRHHARSRRRRPGTGRRPASVSRGDLLTGVGAASPNVTIDVLKFALLLLAGLADPAHLAAAPAGAPPRAAAQRAPRSPATAPARGLRGGPGLQRGARHRGRRSGRSPRATIPTSTSSWSTTAPPTRPPPVVAALGLPNVTADPAARTAGSRRP